MNDAVGNQHIGDDHSDIVGKHRSIPDRNVDGATREGCEHIAVLQVGAVADRTHDDWRLRSVLIGRMTVEWLTVGPQEIPQCSRIRQFLSTQCGLEGRIGGRKHGDVYGLQERRCQANPSHQLEQGGQTGRIRGDYDVGGNG